MARHLSFLLVLFVLATSLGCGGRVRAVRSEPIHNAYGNALGLDDVRQAVIRAVAKSNWTVRAQESDRVIAFYEKGRRTSIEVEIQFDTRSYSIDPVARSHLKGKKAMKWIRNLSRRIHVELTYAGPRDGSLVAPREPDPVIYDSEDDIEE